MIKIMLDESNINNLTRLCSGSEAIIYQKDNNIYKILNPNSRSKTKKAKLEILNKHNKHYLATPKALLFNEQNNFIGYIMPFIQQHAKRPDLLKTLFDESLTLSDRIHMINCLQYMIDDLNKDGIYIDDFNLSNFLLNNQYRLKFIDTDNFIVDQYESELKSFNSSAISDELTPMSRQRFCFMMFALRFIANPFGQNLSLLNNKPQILEELGRFDFPAKLEKTISSIIEDKDKPSIVDNLQLLNNDTVPYLYPVR